MEELIKLAKQGNKEAFTKLILEIQEELYKIARMRLSNEYDIDEAIQETMIITFKSIRKLRQEEYFKTWVIRILINECNKIYKNNKKKNVHTEEIYDAAVFQGIMLYNENEFDKVNSNINLELLLKQLSYEERMILTLYYTEKYTNKEIGKILNMNENTVKTKMARAKEKIRQIYKEKKEEESWKI